MKKFYVSPFFAFFFAALFSAFAAVSNSSPVTAEKPAYGRPVNVISMGHYYRPGKNFNEVIAAIDADIDKGTDLVVLPECWIGTEPIHLDGVEMKAIAEIAKKHNTYIVSSVRRWYGDISYNSGVLIDRAGQIVGAYNKLFPVAGEAKKTNPQMPGEEPPVFNCDFGKLGIAICFDAHFPELWQRLADKGAELVVFPTAFRGGRNLAAQATLNHYYIINCIGGSCYAYDITGEKILDETGNVHRITFDLERRVYHYDGNKNKVEKLLEEHPDDVYIDKTQKPEAWFVLAPKKPGVNVGALAEQYKMTPIREYFNSHRRLHRKLRGWEFARIGPETLFDGSGFDKWTVQKSEKICGMNKLNPAAKANTETIQWKIANGVMEIVLGTRSIMTKKKYRDFKLHIEFNICPPEAGVKRKEFGSGIYLQKRYEIQIGNSFGREPTKRSCGAVYRTKAPDKNVSKPAGQWQSYDITFRAARYGLVGNVIKKTENARVTVMHNGCLIHNDIEIPNKTGAGLPEGPDAQPILLQNHNNKVQFRNIWLAPLN